VAGSAEPLFLPGKTFTLYTFGNPTVKVVKTRSDGWLLATDERGEQVWYNAAALIGAREVP